MPSGPAADDASAAVEGVVVGSSQVQLRGDARSGDERIRALLRFSRDAVALVDRHGTLTWVSPAVTGILGYEPAELEGANAFDVVHPEDLELSLGRAAEAWASDTMVDPIVIRLRNASGEWQPVEVAVGGVRNDEGDLDAVIINVRDVRGRIEADTALRRREERFRALLEESSDAVVVVDPAANVLYLSPAIEHLFCRRPEEIVGATVRHLVHPDDLPEVIRHTGDVYSTPGASTAIEIRVRNAADEYRWIEVSYTNLTADERVNGIVVHIRDVTERRNAEDAVRESESRFRLLAGSSPIGIFQTNEKHQCVYVNDRWQEITGFTFDEATGYGWTRILHPEDRQRFSVDDPERSLRPVPLHDEFRVVRPSGEVRWVAARIAPMLTDDGRVRGQVGTVEDITERMAAERDRQRLIDIFEATNDIVGIADPKGWMLHMNAAARRFFDLPSDAGLEGINLLDRFPAPVAERILNEIQPVLDGEGMWSGELSVLGAGGEIVPMLAQLLVHRDRDGAVEFYSGVLHDISERKHFETELAHQATHDPLTGLPNRVLLLDRLEVALARARRHQLGIAVLFIDLDHFKVVNDSLGHGLGDRLLVAIAERLSVALRPGDTIARFGGDEFVLLCEDLHARNDAAAIADRVIDTVSGPFTVDEAEVFVGVSIGIAFPDHPDADPANLIRDADAAMYRAKEKGRARWEMFDNAMRASAVDRLDIESSLRRALERRELRVFYQPLVSLVHGEVIGVEALLRWEHPERGLLLPGDFIGVAEETGLIVPVGTWVLEQACRQAQRWQASLPQLGRLTVAVNLSGRQLGHPRLVDDVSEILVGTGIDPGLVELEITESVLMDDVEMSEDTLIRLKELGVKLVVDDFGTGYSSLSYLRRFPVDVLKVDRSFVDGLGTDPSDSAIVTAIISLAHTLGLQAVGEGVETEVQLGELRELGCDRAQGYYFARPGPGHDVGDLLAHSPHWH